MLLKFTRGAVIGATAVAALGWAAMSPASATMVIPSSTGYDLNGNPMPGLYQTMDSLYGAGNWKQFDDTLVQTATNNGTTIGVNFVVRYARDPSTFGVWKDTTTFTPFMSTSNSAGPNPPVVIITSDMLSTNPGGQYDLGFRNDATHVLFSSDDTKNPDGLPHLIEFQILNLTNTFVMAWKDTVGLGDKDYNDLILQYTVSFNPSPTPVPEPITISLLGGALLLAGGARGYARARSSRNIG